MKVTHNTAFRSTSVQHASQRQIERRARQLAACDHGDLAVLLARLEWAAKERARVDADPLSRRHNRDAADEQVAAALAAIDVVVP